MSTQGAAKIDFPLIRSLAEDFPGGSWQRVSCARLHLPTTLNPRARAWELLNHVEKRGGNYAFMFPREDFSGRRTIMLDGPARRMIPFTFSADSHPVADGLFVAYVGKAANLRQRFEWHFSLGVINTGAPVQYGLVKSGVCADRAAAVDFMLKHSFIAYRELNGDENVTNRDLVELSLCARFAPPFNIKSER